jgi:hypothetical protein
MRMTLWGSSPMHIPAAGPYRIFASVPLWIDAGARNERVTARTLNARVYAGAI